MTTTPSPAPRKRAPGAGRKPLEGGIVSVNPAATGQTKPVMVHHLLSEGTIDEDVMEALNGKNDMQEALLNALKKRVEMYVNQG